MSDTSRIPCWEECVMNWKKSTIVFMQHKIWVANKKVLIDDNKAAKMIERTLAFSILCAIFTLRKHCNWARKQTSVASSNNCILINDLSVRGHVWSLKAFIWSWKYCPQDLGHSFSLYGPPSRPITYNYWVHRSKIAAKSSCYSHLRQ